MTDQDIVRHLAEKVMGWKAEESLGGLYITNPSDHRMRRFWDAGRTGADYWNPLESIADAFEVQAAIPEEKRWDYLMELREVVGATIDPLTTTGGVWSLVAATPRQRCLAALEATR